MTALAHVRKVFFDDHNDRDLPTPVIVAELANHYVIRLDDPATQELLRDAEFYASPTGPDEEFPYALRRSARAVVRELRRAALKGV